MDPGPRSFSLPSSRPEHCVSGLLVSLRGCPPHRAIGKVSGYLEVPEIDSSENMQAILSPGFWSDVWAWQEGESERHEFQFCVLNIDLRIELVFTKEDRVTICYIPHFTRRVPVD